MTSSLLDIIVRSSGGSLANPLAKFKDVQTLHVIIHALTLEGTASGQTIDEQSPPGSNQKNSAGNVCVEATYCYDYYFPLCHKAAAYLK